MRPWPVLVVATAVLAACSSSTTRPSFCDTAQATASSCANATPCDGTFGQGCADLGAAVSAGVLAAAQSCMQSGVCGVASCIANAPKNAVRSLAQDQLADRYCNACAPDVDGCSADFYDNESKLPGPIVLPYSDAVVKAVIDACITDGSPCRGTFVACATKTITDVVTGALPSTLAQCVLQGFRNDPVDTGPGGTLQVSRCTAQSCDGCCRNDACQPGSTSQACGTGGDACATCSGSQTCTGGACVTGCSPDSCAGCCDGTTCRVGNAVGACGTRGGICRVCGNGAACSAGSCVDAACTASCTSGCCSANGCEAGTAAAACGDGGGACTDCGVGRTCSRSKTCTLDANALWDFYVASAVLPATNPSGAPWDTDGLPDPYLIASSGTGARVHSGRTRTLTDTTTPAWQETPLQGISSSELFANLSFVIDDEDADADDFIGGCAIALTPAMFDGSLQTTECPGVAGSSDVKLSWRIRPH